MIIPRQTVFHKDYLCLPQFSLNLCWKRIGVVKWSPIQSNPSMRNPQGLNHELIYTMEERVPWVQFLFQFDSHPPLPTLAARFFPVLHTVTDHIKYAAMHTCVHEGKTVLYL